MSKLEICFPRRVWYCGIFSFSREILVVFAAECWIIARLLLVVYDCLLSRWSPPTPVTFEKGRHFRRFPSRLLNFCRGLGTFGSWFVHCCRRSVALLDIFLIGSPGWNPGSALSIPTKGSFLVQRAHWPSSPWTPSSPDSSSRMPDRTHHFEAVTKVPGKLL